MDLIYTSTRQGKEKVKASEAILKGLASDGGLFVPETIPTLDADIDDLAKMDYKQTAFVVMRKFLTDFTDEELQNCIDKASETMSAESGKQVKSVAYYAAQLDYKRLKKSMQKQHRKEERHNKLKSLSVLLGHSIPSYISNKNMREITNNKGSIGAIDGRSESVVSGDINNTMGKNSVNNNVNVNSNSNVDLDTDFESPLL